MQVKKQQLEPDMEQHPGSKLGKEYVGSQEIPGITGKFGLGVQNEAGKG